MRTKVTLVLLFLNVALFFFIFYLRPQWATEERLKEARRRVLGPESVNIQSLEIVAGGRTVRLVKRGEAWALTQPFDWPANPFAVNRILTTLQNLQHETSFAVADLAKNGQSLADYGLEKPSLTVTFTSGLTVPGVPGQELPRTTLCLGDVTKDGNRLYVLSPDRTRVHVVDRSLAESLALPAEQLRSDALFNIQVFEVRSFNLLTAAPANLRIRLRHDGNSWAFETPIVARASKAATELAINLLYNLHVHSFVDAPPPPELSPATSRTLSLTLEGNNRRETLVLGGAVGPTAPAPGQPAPTSADYYGQIEGKSVFFTVTIPLELVNVLRNAQTDLRERRVLDFDARAVTAITLRAPNAPELVLQRLETTAATGGVTPWQIVRRDGNQAPLTQPADAEAVKRLLEKLSQLSAQDFLTEAPTSADLDNWGFNNPQREVVLALAGSPSPAAPTPATALPPRRSATLKIGVGAERGPSANAFDGDHYYRVDAEILRELPLEIRAWRDRRLRELPAGAQITALKLTDIATKAVLFDKTLAAATGTAAPDAALLPLLDQLRTLRAKAFYADRFTSTVTIEGAERPWKYQLDVTVALVGGAGTQSSTYTLLFSDRIGGGTQIAGAQDLDAEFEIEQPLLDALWKLTYGPQDPGPAPSTPPPSSSTPPASSAQPQPPSTEPAPAAQPTPPSAQPVPAAQPATPAKANP
jgi:Domain of unknown function (DUF4340)